jgi:hypothetical protein
MTGWSGRFSLLALFAISDANNGTRRASGRPRIVLIHVGKAGGDSVNALLRAHCARSRCDLPTQVHLRRATPADVANASAVVVTLRDPVERAVSAFNWRHPRGGGLRESAHLSPTETLLYVDRFFVLLPPASVVTQRNGGIPAPAVRVGSFLLLLPSANVSFRDPAPFGCSRLPGPRVRPAAKS